MLERSETLAREEAAATAATHKRTKYVIKTEEGFYLRAGFHWTLDVDEAQRFDYMTSANGHAIMVLNLDKFSVEPV